MEYIKIILPWVHFLFNLQMKPSFFLFPFPGFILSLYLSLHIFTGSSIKCLLILLQTSTQSNLSDNLSMFHFFAPWYLSLSLPPPFSALFRTAAQISFWSLSSHILEFPLSFSFSGFCVFFLSWLPHFSGISSPTDSYIVDKQLCVTLHV